MESNFQKPDNNDKPYSFSKAFLRGMVLYGVSTFISLLSGIGIFLIWMGLIHIILWFAPYWKPAHDFAVKVLNIQTSNREFKQSPITWWRLIIISSKAALIFYIIYMGCMILLTYGFFNQNLIYLILANRK